MCCQVRLSLSVGRRNHWHRALIFLRLSNAMNAKATGDSIKFYVSKRIDDRAHALTHHPSPIHLFIHWATERTSERRARNEQIILLLLNYLHEHEKSQWPNERYCATVMEMISRDKWKQQTAENNLRWSAPFAAHFSASQYKIYCRVVTVTAAIKIRFDRFRAEWQLFSSNGSSPHTQYSCYRIIDI